jgi:hypothetical protein
MMAKLHFDVANGSDFEEKPREGTSTWASSWHDARVPVNRKCFEASSMLIGWPVDFQTILKVMREGVAMESSAGPRNRVSHICVKLPCCWVRAAQYSPAITPKSVVGEPKAMRFPWLSVPIPVKVLARATWPLK